MLIETSKIILLLKPFSSVQQPFITEPTKMLQTSPNQLPGTCLYLYIDWLGFGKCVHSHWSSTSWGRDNADLTSSSLRRLQRTRWLAEAEGSHPDGTASERSETLGSSRTLCASKGKGRDRRDLLSLTHNGNKT